MMWHAGICSAGTSLCGASGTVFCSFKCNLHCDVKVGKGSVSLHSTGLDSINVQDLSGVR